MTTKAYRKVTPEQVDKMKRLQRTLAMVLKDN